MFGQGGDDTRFCWAGTATPFGGIGADELTTDGGGSLYGGRGADTLTSRGGNDLMNGGAGVDQIAFAKSGDTDTDGINRGAIAGIQDDLVSLHPDEDLWIGSHGTTDCARGGGHLFRGLGRQRPVRFL